MKLDLEVFLIYSFVHLVTSISMVKEEKEILKENSIIFLHALVAYINQHFLGHKITPMQGLYMKPLTYTYRSFVGYFHILPSSLKVNFALTREKFCVEQRD